MREGRLFCAARPCPAGLGEKAVRDAGTFAGGGACLGGVWDYVTEEGVLSRLQDVTDIIRQNRAAQNAQKCGFQKAPTFRRVASIPVAVVDIAAAQGLDILNDPEAMRKFLNDPDNRAFRTTLERV